MPPDGTLKPIYNFMDDLPGLGGAVPPFLPQAFVKRTLGNLSSFDAGRGCPFQCSFCTIINVQGRKSRFRSPDDVEQILRRNWEQGVDRFFITDDNFARNKDWEAIFDRIIELRERDKMDVRFMIQVDTLCHKIPNFITKAKRAGVTRIFIGLENINPGNLLAAKKRQNKITEYRKMLLAWKAAGIWTYAGYILGFPNDTPESIRHDIEIVKHELPLDILEFFVPDAAAGLRRPQGARGQGRRDGCRSQQIRSRARRHRASEDEQGRSGKASTGTRGSSTTRASTSRRSSSARARRGSTSTG